MGWIWTICGRSDPSCFGWAALVVLAVESQVQCREISLHADADGSVQVGLEPGGSSGQATPFAGKRPVAGREWKDEEGEDAPGEEPLGGSEVLAGCVEGRDIACVGLFSLTSMIRPGVELKANLESISHRCHLEEIAFV